MSSKYKELRMRRRKFQYGNVVCSQIAWFMLVGLRERYQHCTENTKPQTHVDCESSLIGMHSEGSENGLASISVQC